MLRKLTRTDIKHKYPTPKIKLAGRNWYRWCWWWWSRCCCFKCVLAHGCMLLYNLWDFIYFLNWKSVVLWFLGFFVCTCVRGFLFLFRLGILWTFWQLNPQHFLITSLFSLLWFGRWSQSGNLRIIAQQLQRRLNIDPPPLTKVERVKAYLNEKVKHKTESSKLEPQDVKTKIENIKNETNLTIWQTKMPMIEPPQPRPSPTSYSTCM